MWQRLKSEWHKIDFQKLENSLCRMPQIYIAVFAVKGT